MRKKDEKEGLIFFLNRVIENHLEIYQRSYLPSAQAGYDTRSIFKRSLTGFNLEFSFS